MVSKRVKDKGSYTIGVISDTHGRLLSSVYTVFQNVDLIIHAGDIDSKEVLERLQSIAPVVAVRGNMDYGSWAEALPESETIEIGELVVYIRHILGMVPASARVHAVIYGHTHQPAIERQNGTLFLNPGSAGQRRYDNPLSVARLQVHGKEMRAEIIELKE